ncbi:Superfamily II DNA or RNA helicase, SNF2 family [Methylomagnum ishizawai]|uniref:Superfamily II DNA or RNA helicase, SNF2 family n=1 Tax=Methylomagnum ishizawai TaxID=1760988 RepID=A0A1Y6D095_9GAMM|nr:DEAD/DEAH box helicase [Methylomagnum ishizawai]SMF93425.1 Superfamily II DNA or RNA helicase, SNF2 family [Methylomagnum ishizawai]
MKVLHCAWIPESGESFVQAGDFWLWAEQGGTGAERGGRRHPRHLPKTELIAFLENPLGLTISSYERRFHFLARGLSLPTAEGLPVPAPEFEHGGDEEPPPAALELWELDAYRLTRPIRQLGELRFLAYYHGPEAKPGGDLLFWHYFTQSLKAVILRDRYIPALVYRVSPEGGRELYAGWEIVSDDYERLIHDAAQRMPDACAIVGGSMYEKTGLLRHCAEVLVKRLVAQAAEGSALERGLRGTLLEACVAEGEPVPWKAGEPVTLYRQWQAWRGKLAARREESDFTLVLQLHEAFGEREAWRLELLVAPRQEPSRQVPLAEYWRMDTKAKRTLGLLCGGDLDKKLLLALGQAARIYPPLWEGLDEARPWGIALGLEDAFAFLHEGAWVLEDAGFMVLVPAWWTPQGRRRAKVRLRAGGKHPTGSGRRDALDVSSLIAYRYDLALGDEVLDEQEWQSLVESKSPLVRFRGRWLALDRDKMREMLDFWRRHQQGDSGMSLPELMRKAAEDEDFFEIEARDNLAEMLDKLRDHSRLQPAADPPGFGAALRDYQRRGLAWIAFLESLGLNGCLADDMGLGKTIQVLARLAEERVGGAKVAPTLLVAPTSVIGNWKREIERFTPELRAFIHHGTVRLRDAAKFQAICLDHDVVITSYALARKDEKVLAPIAWKRVVLDEAQNIKNPLSAQTKAVLKLNAEHRLALTGTPVENRLLDLWSIFNFLNPGYLGRQSHFRQRYELPIQRDNDPRSAETLKRLIEPFVLRRVKTDPDIMRDLPDKLENRQFCNLCREQASLYEAVVRDVERHLNEAEGFNRQGLILSTLTRLKQICNHPTQFLRDGSPFSPLRSPKLERLRDMLGDVVGEGESALVFTQFAEIGERLEKYLAEALDCPIYYLHGAVPAAKRERMIAEFQNPDTGPAVFVLSLRAGGVGITLTKANHVFHFDRWWNPAVEDQATDRAFRIGQQKNVFVHKFITLGTLEERIDRLIEEKKEVASLIVGNDESWLSRLDNETFRELIALNRMAVLE